jgi:hypothetical protein
MYYYCLLTEIPIRGVPTLVSTFSYRGLLSAASPPKN